MNENKLNQPEGKIKLDLILSPDSIKDIVRRDRYVLLNNADLQGLDIDIDDLSDELEKEGFKRHRGIKDEVLYDPSKFEVKDVNVYKGLDKKFGEEGWKEISRSGEWAVLIKEK